MPTPPTKAEQARKTLEFIAARQRAYQGIPDLVLEDLRRFCRAESECYDADPRMHALLEGRRETWLRIHRHLTWTPAQLLEHYTQGQLTADMAEGT